MNRITLQRTVLTPQSTIGELDVFGYKVYTLEDTRRLHKVWGETRIPAGTYWLKLRSAGGMHERYKLRFPDLHQGMIHLQNVPFFEWVYIHVGNTAADTQGCILVGMKAEENYIRSSKDAYQLIYPKIAQAIRNGGCVITINDEEPENV